ncbi:hypothetical protein IJH16_02495 [Candidatus Saccharibacteria bacterium]|nr:hypothetical protein [Candidatus Saccharibacteria bacterium]
MKRVKKICLYSAMLAVLIASFGIIFPVSAISSETLERAMVGDLKRCYESGFLKPEINIADFSYGKTAGTSIFNGDGVEVNLPNGTLGGDGNYTQSDNITCKDLFLGKGGFAGLGLGEVAVSDDSTKKVPILQKLGYTAVPNSATEHCYSARFHNRDTDAFPDDIKVSEKVCVTAVDGKISDDKAYPGNLSGNRAPFFILTSENGYISIEFISMNLNSQDSFTFAVGDPIGNIQSGLSSMISNIMNNAIGHQVEIISPDGGSSLYYLFDEVSEETKDIPGGGIASKWELTNPSGTAGAWGHVLGTNAYTLTNLQKRELNEYYLANYGDFSCKAESGYKKVSFVIDGNSSDMWVKKKADFNGTLYTTDDSNGWTGVNTTTYDALLDSMNGKTLYEGYISACTSEDDDPTNPGGSGGLDLKECFNGADALGWILCPVIKFLHATVQNIYDSIIEPFLQVNVSAFNTSSGTFQGWQVFQGIANVLFVILFLFVIFSQVTGIGIDNYGIKRILPKLIVTAILINISYFICQLLVDASNILGAGLEGIFSNVQINGSAVSTGQSALTTAITGLVGAAGIGGAIATAEMWVPALIVPLLLGLITILVSVAFMFVLLGVRQAGVIILVVVAPVAFVCYMLPNTKPIFDKWKKMLEGLLLLYPICGALIGGSALASKILTSSSNNFFMHLLAALLTVVPFFFVPKLLQGAFSAMGNIGGKISAMGSNLGRRAGGAVANSQAVKDAQLRAAAGVNSRGEATAMGKRMDKIARGKSIFSRVPGMQRAASRSMARGRAAYLKDRSDQLREDRLNTEGYMESAIAEQDAQLDTEQVATEQAKIEGSAAFTTGNYAAVANDMVDLMRTDSGGNNSAKIRAIQNALNKIGDDGRSAMGTAMEGLDFASISNEARQAWASNLLGAHAADFKNNARSQYEAAKANTGTASSGNFNDFVAGGSRAPKVDSYRPEQFANMDDGEFNSIMNAVNNMKKLQSNSSEWGKLSSEEQSRINNYVSGIQKVANSAVSDPRLRSSLKGSRAEGLAKLSEGYINVHNSGNSGSAPSGGADSTGGAGNASGGSSTETLDEIMQEAGYQERRQQRADNMDAADRVGDNYEEIFDNQRDNS